VPPVCRPPRRSPKYPSFLLSPKFLPHSGTITITLIGSSPFMRSVLRMAA
jgi:hypothetical protein